MPKQYKFRICARHSGVVRRAAWVRLGPKGDISVGLAERNVTVGKIQASVEDGDPEIIDLSKTLNAEALRDPHFTLHPPAYFHLRADRNPKLLSALVWTTHENHRDCSPWLRISTSPVSELEVLREPRAKDWILDVGSEQGSLGFHFDFVNEKRPARDGISKFIEWGDVIVRVRAIPLPGQPASVGYLIEG